MKPFEAASRQWARTGNRCRSSGFRKVAEPVLVPTRSQSHPFTGPTPTCKVVFTRLLLAPAWMDAESRDVRLVPGGTHDQDTLHRRRGRDVGRRSAGDGDRHGGSRSRLDSSPQANTKTPGVTAPNTLAPQLVEIAVAQGSIRLENPRDGVGYYGYDSVNGNPPLVPVPPATDEAHKTEPDKNTYLRLARPDGPGRRLRLRHPLPVPGPRERRARLRDPGQPGRRRGPPGHADGDPGHARTSRCRTSTAPPGTPSPSGSSSPRRTAATAACGRAVRPTPRTRRLKDISGALGRGGFEGIQVASDGNLWLVEDVGGTHAQAARRQGRPTATSTGSSRQREVDLTAGELQVLQVLRRRRQRRWTPRPTRSVPDIKNLHTYGTSFRTRWVTIHDTANDGTASFCATTRGRDGPGGTQFKRPENGMFRPGTGFKQFYFTETGDTNADSTANAQYGGWGGVFRLRQSSPSAATGRLSPAFRGDKAHTGLDNLTFATSDSLLVVEDAGDTLHEQRNALDSGYVLDVSQARPSAAPVPRRGPRRLGHDRLGAAATPARPGSQRRRQRDHRHPRLRRGPDDAAACSAPTCRRLFKTAGGRSGPSSTATTSPTSWSPHPTSPDCLDAPGTRCSRTAARPPPARSVAAAGTHGCRGRRASPPVPGALPPSPVTGRSADRSPSCRSRRPPGGRRLPPVRSASPGSRAPR